MNIIAATESALAAGLLRQQVAANNIANSSTPGFRAQRVDLKQALSGGVETQISARESSFTTYDARGRTGEQQPSDVDLAEEAVELLKSQHDVEVNVATLRRAHEVQGSLLDVLA